MTSAELLAEINNLAKDYVTERNRGVVHVYVDFGKGEHALHLTPSNPSSEFGHPYEDDLSELDLN
jgi:hypothetical protein